MDVTQEIEQRAPMVCTSLGSLLRPLFYFRCYIHFSLSVVNVYEEAISNIIPILSDVYLTRNVSSNRSHLGAKSNVFPLISGEMLR